MPNSSVYIFLMLKCLTMTWFSEKMLIFNICRHCLMPNLIKKSWTVSNLPGIRSVSGLNDLNSLSDLNDLYSFNNLSDLNDFYSLISSRLWKYLKFVIFFFYTFLCAIWCWIMANYFCWDMGCIELKTCTEKNVPQRLNEIIGQSRTK